MPTPEQDAKTRFDANEVAGRTRDKGGTYASAAQQVAPAGGTGATAGAYDTAANRDKLINLVNAMRDVLIERGFMKGSA